MTNLENNIKREAPKRVLFLALSGIGNLVMQLPTIRELKKAHPDWHITVWVAPRGTKEIAETEKTIDHIVEMPIKASPVQHLKQIQLLRKQRFDIGIVLSPGQLLKSAAYLKLAGIPVRIGNTYPLRGNPHSGFLLTHAVDEDSGIHDIEQNLLLLKPLGITPEPVPYYSLEVPEENKQEAEILLTTYNLQLTTSVVGIHPGSAPGFEWKRWPLERFATVAQELIKKNPNTTILIFGSKDEEEQKQELVSMINSSPPLTKGRLGGVHHDQTPSNSPLVRGRTVSAPLLTTAAAIQKCNLFISNDSGLMHIAAAVGVPTLGLFGPTNEKQTGPRGKQSFTIRASDTTSVYHTEHSYSFGATPHESMLGITEKIILKKIEQIGF